MAQSSTVAEYVQNLGGDRVIDKVLIANNGIGAVKAIRSIRQWAYKTFGNEKAVQFVVMATPEDLHANAEYIKMADEFEEVPGGSNNNNYANVNLIVDIAQKTGVQGVWAGWGHASENPNLPRSLTAVGINFLGPPAGPMQALGDKISSTLVAQTAQVPSVPWSGTGIQLQNYNVDTGIEDSIYQKACVTTPEEAKSAAKK
jgi:acetyl-CoA carboxylase/biotin carboxylase 1